MTLIQWTDWPGRKGETWNPTTGCTRVSPGCDNCYAFALHDQRYAAKRRGAALPSQYDVPFSTVQMLDDRRLEEPLRWREPRAVFVGSMADLFHDDVTDAFLDRVFAVMALSPRLEFMLLTKRPERARAYLTWTSRDLSRQGAIQNQLDFRSTLPRTVIERWPLPNVGLMTTTEDQERADQRIPALLETPAAWHGVSVEPMLGPVSFRYEHLHGDSRLDWVICGGESGARTRVRPFDLAWARALRDECAGAGVPFFLKQLGSLPVERRRETKPTGPRMYPSGQAARTYRTLNVRVPGVKGHGGDPEAWPEDLQRRQWPRHALDAEPAKGGA